MKSGALRLVKEVSFLKFCITIQYNTI